MAGVARDGLENMELTQGEMEHGLLVTVISKTLS
jgi:hypothetical protein